MPDPNIPTEVVDQVPAEEIPQEDSVDTEETTPDGEETETPPAEETPAEEDDGFEGFVKEHELPEGIKTPEQLAASYKEVLQQMKRFQTESGKERTTVEEPPKKEPQQSYFNEKPMTAFVKTWEEQGMFSDPEVAKQYHGLARVFDSAIGPELKKVDMVLNTMASELMAIRERTLTSEWRAVSPEIRSKIKKDDIDTLMREHRLPDYDTAVRFFVMTKRPDLIGSLTEKAKQEGIKEGQKQQNKHKYRWSSARGSGGQQNQGAVNYADYIDSNGTIDNRKLNRLPEKQRAKILDAIIAEGKKAGLG